MTQKEWSGLIVGNNIVKDNTANEISTQINSIGKLSEPCNLFEYYADFFTGEGQTFPSGIKLTIDKGMAGSNVQSIDLRGELSAPSSVGAIILDKIPMEKVGMVSGRELSVRPMSFKFRGSSCFLFRFYTKDGQLKEQFHVGKTEGYPDTPDSFIIPSDVDIVDILIVTREQLPKDAYVFAEIGCSDPVAIVYKDKTFNQSFKDLEQAIEKIDEKTGDSRTEVNLFTYYKDIINLQETTEETFTWKLEEDEGELSRIYLSGKAPAHRMFPKYTIIDKKRISDFSLKPGDVLNVRQEDFSDKMCLRIYFWDSDGAILNIVMIDHRILSIEVPEGAGYIRIELTVLDALPNGATVVSSDYSFNSPYIPVYKTESIKGSIEELTDNYINLRTDVNEINQLIRSIQPYVTNTQIKDLLNLHIQMLDAKWEALSNGE